ncbi:MAG TPA: hypothetical protein VGC79_08075 [Polyangiaceae bacterium]
MKLFHTVTLLFALELSAKLARADRTPRLFISCAQECFDSYLRQELSYFDVVRDRYLSDFTLVIARQPAANGGERFAVTLVRARSDPSHAPSPSPAQSFVALPGASVRDIRQQLLQALLRTLQVALAGTPHERVFELRIPARNGGTLSALDDPWHFWVVTPELLGYCEGASGYFSGEFVSALTLRRITEPSKLRLRGAYSRKLSSYRLEDGSQLSGDVYAWDARAIYAASIGEHWALGGALTGRGSEFENLKGHAHAGPLLEYNVFPYTQNASEQLRWVYQVGVWANSYFEENVAGRMHEARPYHALSLIADLNQAWGSLQWVGQLNSFLDASERYRVSVGIVSNIRLFKGLSFTSQGRAALVRDQISLRQRSITDPEIVLRTAQQATNYTFEVQFGLSFSFGSVYNTIVNPRFGRVDLDEE